MRRGRKCGQHGPFVRRTRPPRIIANPPNSKISDKPFRLPFKCGRAAPIRGTFTGVPPCRWRCAGAEGDADDSARGLWPSRCRCGEIVLEAGDVDVV